MFQISSILIFFLSAALIIQVQASTRIAVIGAGLSGLTAGYRLKQAGLDVKVFEARRRAGGRVFTIQMGDNFQELGGQSLCDGGAARHIIELCEELDIPVVNIEKNFTTWIYDHQTDQLLDLYQDLGERLPKINEEETARLQKLATSCPNMHEVINEFIKDPLMRRIYETRMRSYEGIDSKNLAPNYASGSFLSMLLSGKKNLERVKKGESLNFSFKMIQDGNGRLIEALSNQMGTRLHLNSPLTRITHDQSTYKLTFQNGSMFSADLLILTIPASTFKNIEISDQVIHPDQMKQIRSHTYGTIAKIVTPLQQWGDKAAFLNTEHMITFNGSSEKNMTFYYAGSKALIMNEEELNAVYARDFTIFNKAHPDPQSQKLKTVRTPGEAQFEKYDSPVGIAWAYEPYTLGGYSVYSPDQHIALTDLIEILGEKVIRTYRPAKNTLFFAGEHTAFEHPATMEGAVESGERTVRMILRSLQDRETL